MKWSAVITTYNSEDVIETAIHSLISLPPEERADKIVVVDNASTDNTLKRLSSFEKQITIIRNKSNLGLSAANNIGASNTVTPYLFFLNPDIEILPGAITALAKSAKNNPEAALIGPGMIDETDEQQSTARSWPTPIVVAARRTFLKKTKPGKKIAANHLNQFNTIAESSSPHWLVGAAMLLTPEGRSNVGLMSQKYFLYFEDVEWCWRAWSRGMTVVFEPKAKIRHVCHRESASGGVTLKFHLKSMLRFYFTHPGVFFGYKPGKCV